MLEKRALMIINISLTLITLLLLLHLVGVELPSMGGAFYALDQHDPLCIVEWQDEQRKLSDIPRCCLEARKQAHCQWHLRETVFGGTEWKCQTTTNDISYLINNKAYHYCTQLPFW